MRPTNTSRPRLPTITAFSAVLVVGAICYAGPEDSWPQFRGTQAAGVAEGKPAPLTWDVESGENVLWKAPIQGLSHSSPIVWTEGDQSTVYVTTAVGQEADASFKHGLYGSGDASEDRTEHRFVVMALDAATGKSRWETTVHQGKPKEKRHIKATYNNQTPATNGEVIVAFFGSEGLFGLDIKGNLLWKIEVGRLDVGAYDAPTYEWGSASSPIIFNDLAIIQCDTQAEDFLLAVDVKTGKERWRTRREQQPSWGTPTAFPATDQHPAVLVTNGPTHIIGYDPATGKELWRLGGSSPITAPTPIAAQDAANQDLFIVASGRRPNKPIFAIKRGAEGDISLADGKTANHSIAWSSTGSGPYMPTPVVVGERLFVLQNNGVLDGYDVATGEQLYRQRLRHAGGGFSGSPVASADRIYLPGEDGDIFVVAAGDEYQELAVNTVGERVMSTPAIVDGTLFIKGEHHLFAFRDSD